VYAAADHNLEKKNISDNDYFSEAIFTDDLEKTFIEKIDSLENDDIPDVLTISSPIYTNSGFSGVVALDLNFDTFSNRLFRPLESTKNGQIFLLDKNYRILWTENKNLIGREASKEFFKFDLEGQAMWSGESRLPNINDLNRASSLKEANGKKNIDYLFAVSSVQIDNASWFLAIGALKSEALLSLNDVALDISILVSLMIVVIIVTAGLFVVHLIRAGSKLEGQVNFRTRQLKESEDNFRRIAEILQEALIAPIPYVPSLNIAVGYKAAYKPERVGGDFYDVFPVDDGKIALLIGDVAGKGIEAAGFTETIRSTIRAHATTDYSPSYVLSKTSESLIGRIKYFEYATTLYAVLDINNRTLRVASAGHPPIIIFDDLVDNVRVETGMPLGQMIGKYKESIVSLREESGILLYTDGLLEARRDRDFFGDYRVKEILENNFHIGSQGLVDELLSNVTEFADGEIDDDIALIVIRFSSPKINNDQIVPLRFPLVRE